MTIGPDRLSPKVTAAAVTAGLAAGVWAVVSARITGSGHVAVTAPLAVLVVGGTTLAAGYNTVDPCRIAVPIADGLYETPAGAITGRRAT